VFGWTSHGRITRVISANVWVAKRIAAGHKGRPDSTWG
jgi:hypothetical protein